MTIKALNLNSSDTPHTQIEQSIAHDKQNRFPLVAVHNVVITGKRQCPFFVKHLFENSSNTNSCQCSEQFRWIALYNKTEDRRVRVSLPSDSMPLQSPVELFHPAFHASARPPDPGPSVTPVGAKQLVTCVWLPHILNRSWTVRVSQCAASKLQFASVEPKYWIIIDHLRPKLFQVPFRSIKAESYLLHWSIYDEAVQS